MQTPSACVTTVGSSSETLGALPPQFERRAVAKAAASPTSPDTELHRAARSGDLSGLTLLVERGTNLEQANADGKTALHEAAQFGHVEVAEALLRAGCQVDALKRSDWTPLMLACTKRSLDMIALLIESGGANATLRNKDGWTAFQIASREGSLPVVRYFINKFGAEIALTRSRNQRTPLHTASLTGLHEVVRELLASDRRFMNASDACGSTPFMDAIRSLNVEACQTLISFGADPFIQDALGRNALHVAVECGARDALNYLLNGLKFDVNCVEAKSGCTGLHIAAREGNEDMITCLVNNGADKNIRDFKGRLPEDYATMYKREKCVALLKSIQMAT